MLGIGMGELLIVLAIGLLLFGKHLPAMARSLGGTVADIRKEVRDIEEDVRLPA